MTDGYRKAALKLHGMNAADQGWMLQRLPEIERTRLQVLLRELRELGIKPDRHASDNVAADEARQRLLATVTESEATARALDSLIAASIGEISVLLAAEPGDIVAVVLSIYPWPWRARYLAECGVEKRQRIHRALQQATVPTPRVRSELIKLLGHRLDGVRHQQILLPVYVSERAAVARAPRARAFLKGLQRWLP